MVALGEGGLKKSSWMLTRSTLYHSCSLCSPTLWYSLYINFLSSQPFYAPSFCFFLLHYFPKYLFSSPLLTAKLSSFTCLLYELFHGHFPYLLKLYYFHREPEPRMKTKIYMKACFFFGYGLLVVSVSCVLHLLEASYLLMVKLFQGRQVLQRVSNLPSTLLHFIS